MCGIIGVIKSGGAVEEAYRGLRRLEYRGYDSAGLSVRTEDGIVTVKRGGRVSELEPLLDGLEGDIAIGHTRWATHGQPTDENAHPHTSGKFSVVHNGIIENYRELKDELISRGITFLSDTDSEVIVKLIDENYSGNVLKAVAAAVKRLRGSFALGVLCTDFNGIIAVKYKSPAVIGFSEDGAYLCSDIPALPSSVASVYIPEDGDIAVIRARSVKFRTFSLKPVNRVRSAIFLGQFAAGKGDYPHYMLKEIYEDERTVRQTAEGFVRYVDTGLLGGYVRGARRIILTGCGTAYNAGLVAQRFFSECTGAFCSVEIAGELRYSLPKVDGSTLVVAISQSGETADTVEAAQALKEAGAKVVAVTNCGYSAITRVAHLVVPVCAGAEICVAATKSYVGQIAALYLMAETSCGAFRPQDALEEICPKIGKVLTENAAAEEIARECVKSSAVFFLGRGVDYAVAVEASLKLKEVSYIFSDGYPAGELKHGTLALVDENTLGVCIICDPALAEKSENAVEQVISRKGKAAVITTIGSVAEKFKDRAKVWLLPQCPAPLSPFLSAAALQLVAYRAAVMLGRDPDKPRNLAKSVTVE